MKIRSLLITFILMLFSFHVWADNYRYNADVKGMVCAFCAYSVSKNISKLPGVDADSVDVDLKGGHVVFNSSKKVSEEKLAGLFTSSGFSISNLRVSETSEKSVSQQQRAELELRLDALKIDQLSNVIEAIGNIAASHPLRILIKAPAALEDTILKPLLMGRQQVVKVRFIATESDSVHLLLFETLANGNL